MGARSNGGALARIRDRAEAFLIDERRGYFEALAGYRDAPGLEETFARYPELFRPERVREVERALTAADGTGEEARRLRRLREFLASGVEKEAAKSAEERYLAAEANAVVAVDGETIPFRSVRVRLRNTPERERRVAIGRAALEVSRALQPHLHAELEAAHAGAARLGGADYVQHRAALSGIDFAFLLAETSRLLEETEVPYRDLLAFFARKELGLRAADVGFWDLPALLRGARFDSAFAPDAMVPAIGGVVGAMGLDPTAEGRVTFDLEPRPKKTARAFCSPIRIPAEVKLVVLPAGGADDYRAFLHELGHALHYGYVAPEAPFEFRALGDNSITECYAMTFDHCLLLPQWLADVPRLGTPREFLLLHWFGELFLLRRYAAKLRYELALHARGPRAEMAERYAEELGRATAVETPAERYLEDVDPRFYCVCYLQAWMLAGLLHRALRERFDTDWYRNPRTGVFLRGLFERGQRDTPAELAALLGVGELGFGALLAWMREGLGGEGGG